MNGTFDWNLARSFLAALDHGSLLAAARALGTTQPTVGRHIAELEERLGLVLFERTGRGLLPTEAAARLAQGARAMDSGAQQFARTAAGADPAEAGTVRLSASQPVACCLLPVLLARMRLDLPHVQIELVVSNQVSNLLRREADIAIRMVQPDQTSLVARRIGKVTIGTFAHRDYLRRRGVPREASELRQHDLIGGDRNEDILKGFAAFGQPMDKRDFVLRTDDLIAYSEAVRAAVGIGFLPHYMARSESALVPLLPALKIPPVPMWLVVHREIRSNPRIRAAYGFLAGALPPLL